MIIFILFKGDESPNDDDNNIEDHKRFDLSLLNIKIDFDYQSIIDFKIKGHEFDLQEHVNVRGRDCLAMLNQDWEFGLQKYHIER